MPDSIEDSVRTDFEGEDCSLQPQHPILLLQNKAITWITLIRREVGKKPSW